VLAHPHQRLAFSMAHSGDVVLVAVARNRHLGVDCEPVSRCRAAYDAATSFMTESELLTLGGLGPSLRGCASLAHWTRKEALLKGTGDGLATSPETVNMRLATPATGGEQNVLYRRRYWCLVDLPLGTTVGALAVWPRPSKIVFAQGSRT
jgi:phosphopantetheinyl transferase